ncbi:hypothetical protein Vretimale_3488 [Volvox reticuliferus]|uniref:Uncharacterized protein n=2 Tax=Volvox reticuliferus TaxID=1737510 RepID=A0A8J4DDL9_9CHLO|nr:hypothetical protein Vretimale_3488 [Volvox reticuliferus]
MGNTSSRGSRKFLDAEPAWQDYYVAEWRSERSRELDRHGGPGRPPVARGESITAKLVFLEGALKHEQKRMKQVLQVFDDEAQKREQQAAQKTPPERLPDFILNTDFRAYERRHTEDQAAEADGTQQQQRDFSLLAKDPELRRKMMEQRKKMLEYGKRVNVVKGAPGIKPLNLPAIKSKVAASWKPGEQGNHGDEEEGGGDSNVWTSPQPAEWRLRMHQARRRLILLVGAIARWQLALSRRPGPKRLPRVNSFSYFIPQVLGAEAKRFIEEATAIAKIKADAVKVEEPTTEPGLERVPLTEPPPAPFHQQQQQRQSPVDSLADTPEQLRKGRGPPRRGVSDSGFSAAATATAAAVDAESAAAGAAAGATGENAAAASSSSASRPKRRPELQKSSSGKCSSASLPDTLIPGHTSDVEAYAPPRRLCSGRVTSTRLPAIGSGRISSSGLPAAMVPPGGGDINSPPMVQRQPAAKLGRISSSGRQGGRTRRQSDSSLALATAGTTAGTLPAAIAAVTAASPGGVMQRRSSAAAAIRSGAGWRSRGSDCGSLQRQRDCIDAAAVVAAGGQLPDAVRPSVSGGVAAGLCSPLRHDMEQLLATVGSAPTPDSPSSGGGGFLPRIPSSNSTSGGGAGPGSSPSSSKPMSAVQARRLALMAEASNLTGTEEGAGVGRGNTTSSPSRLGPLKLGNGGATPLGSGSSRSPDKAGGGPGMPPTCGGGGSGSGSGGSILDALRQSRDGTLSNVLVAGGVKELRETMSLASGGAPISPIHSPGIRGRTLSLDTSMLGSTIAVASAFVPVQPASPRPTHQILTNALGPASGASSPKFQPHPPPTNQPPTISSSAPPDNAANESNHPVSPTAAPLPLGPPPPRPSPRPVPAAISNSTASASPTVASSSAVSSASATSGTITAASASTSLPTLPTATLSTTPIAAAVAAATASSTGTAPAASLPPLPPPNKPPLGPPGSGERVRSGRSSNAPSPSSNNSSSNPAPPPPPAGSQPATTAATTAAALPPPPPPPSPPPLDPEAAARLAKAQQLMGMYANRVNATWAESQQWVPPSVLSVPEQELFCASDAWVPYKVTVLRMLKAGSLGVHIDACADTVQLPDGTSMDVWTSDPWNLAQRLRPGSLPLSERIEGVSIGARALQQLVLAVESLAGKDAVAKLTVVLAINDDQRNAVVADIIRTRAYGLKPENLVLTAQRKRCGYRYDQDAQAFLEDPSTPAQVLGSGYSLCQLAWLGDAFSVTREGELAMLMGRTLLERFSEQRLEWLVSRRARDLALLTPEGVLDLQHLAFSLYAADRHSGNMVVQAAPAASLNIPRAYDSTLLVLKAPPGSAGAGGGATAVSKRVTSVAASAAGVQGSGGAAGVVDLRAAELSSPVMVEALAAVRKQAGHDGWVGLQRYLIHVPTLHAMLNTLGIFRPKLSMTGDVARLSLDAADITADRRVACVAVHTRSSPAILTSPNEVDDLIPLLLAQDHSAAFRDIIAGANDGVRESVSRGGDGAAGPGAAASASGGTAGSSPAMVLMTTKPGIRILLFIASNDVTQLAVNLVLLMARPGRDVVHLVTVVHNSLQMPTGQALLLKYLKQISNAMIETHSEVLVKGINGLLEVMEGAAARLAPNLVVMASAALTMTNLNTASVMGSVTLSVLKRLTLPVAVATNNSKNLVLTQRRTALRCMVLVDPTSRPALNFLCSSCMEPMRGDKLVLAGHHPTRQMTTQQQQAQRRLVDNFGDIASSHRFHTPTKIQLDGPVDKALTAAAEDEAVHLVGLQIPLGTKGVPGHVLGLIRSCRGGVLVFRDTA